MLAAADPSSHHRQALIQRARQSVLLGAGGEAPLEPWITRSWQRCLSAGLNPGQKVVFNPVDGPALRHLADENHALVQAARPVLEQLTRAIAGMRYFAMLTNARGVVIDVQGAVDRHDPRTRLIGRVGVDLSEAAVGTTAIGAALTELAPVWLHRGEHFCEDNSAYSCAGAPLFDPEGHCMGMLDLTGVDVPERPELRHLVARSARAMEDALLLSRPHDWLLRLNWPGGALGGESDGLVTLDDDGQVLGTNTTARQLLPMPLRSPGSALHSADVFAMPWAMLRDAARQHRSAPIHVPLWSGLRLQAQVLPATPTRAGVWGAAPTPARPPAPLREAESALIRQAVQDARGNVAEAARALGISRATVYRKLGQAPGKH